MKSSSLASAVALTLLFAHGVLALAPVREDAAHLGHVLAFAVEFAWLLWENSHMVSHLRAAIRRKK